MQVPDFWFGPGLPLTDAANWGINQQVSGWQTDFSLFSSLSAFQINKLENK